MTPQILNLIEAMFIGIAGISLFLLAVKRRYPSRSILAYSIIALLGMLGVLTSGGAILRHADELDTDAFSFWAGAFRGATIVGLAILLFYEARYKPRGCKYANRPDSRCHMQSMKLPPRDV